jgi:hypothetical protein
MGQFLKSWNSTQVEQQKRQQQQEQQEQQQQQQQQQLVGSSSPSGGGCVDPQGPPVSSDPRLFLNLLQERLSPSEMAAVKTLLTQYR